MSCTPAVGQLWEDRQGTLFKITSASDGTVVLRKNKHEVLTELISSIENNFTFCSSLRWLVEVFREDEYLGVVATFKSEDDAKDYCLKKNGQAPAELGLFYGYSEAPCDH